MPIPGWTSVSKSQRCPVCDGDHRCFVKDNGEVCMCYRVEGPTERDTNAGLCWFHQLKERDECEPREVRRKPQPEPRPVRDFGGDMAAARRGVDLSGLASDLGLPVDVLQRLGVGRMDATGVKDGRPWSVDCWAFPMRDPGGAEVCIRYRPVGRGRKFSASGDGSGLFVPAGVEGRGSDLIVIEGPTDCGACLAMGEDAIGRPNNTAGNDYVRHWLAWRRPLTTRAVVMIDRDSPDSDTAWAALRTIIAEGLDGEDLRDRYRVLDGLVSKAELSTIRGAVSLARLLNRPPAGRAVTIAVPPIGHKDVRDWYGAGARSDDLWGAVDDGIHLPGRRMAGLRHAIGGAA